MPTEFEEEIPSLRELFYLVIGFFGLDAAINISLIYAQNLNGAIIHTSFEEFEGFVNTFLPVRIRKRLYFEAIDNNLIIVTHINVMHRYGLKLSPNQKILGNFLDNNLLYRQFFGSACSPESIMNEKGYQVDVGATLAYNPEEYVTVWTETCSNYQFEKWHQLAYKFQEFCLAYGLPVLITFSILETRSKREALWAADLDDEFLSFEPITISE